MKRKKLLSVAVLLVFLLGLLSFSVDAQTAGGSGITFIPSTLAASTATNFVLPGPTNATAGIINGGFPANRIVGFKLVSQCMVTNAGTLTACLVTSDDGSTWCTNKPFAFVTNVWTANFATNRIVENTNLDLGAFQYVTCYWLSNSSASGGIATNVSFSFTTKPGF
jgi:hypothetical protein